MQEKTPRWLDKLMCILGWAALLAFTHCVAKQDWRLPQATDPVPVTAPDGRFLD